MIKAIALADRRPIEYIIDDLFWTRTVHLVIGPSGGGKTTWISQYLMKDWSQGLPVLGFKSHPKPFCYLGLDRGYDEVAVTWQKVGLKADFPYHFRREQKDWWSGVNLAWRIVDDTLKMHPEVKVLFVDGFTSLTPNGKINDYATVALFMLQLGALCETHDITVIGLGHTTKLKKDQEILIDRECSIGSVAFGGYAGSMIKISHDPKDEDSRRLVIQPRHTGSRTFHYRFDQGMLLLDEDPNIEEAGATEAATLVISRVLEAIPLGQEFPVQVLKDAANAAKIPPRTQERVFAALASSVGRLERVRRGVYKRPNPS